VTIVIFDENVNFSFLHTKIDDFCVNVHQQCIRKQVIHCLMIMSFMASLKIVL
jgi:hypothetical protein